MTRVLFGALLALTACDTSAPPPEEEFGPPTPNGVLTGLLNGEPFEAPAVYRRGSNGYLLLTADRVGPAPNYRTYSVSFVYLRDPFEAGDVLPLEVTDANARSNGLSIYESLGDAVVNGWDPVPEAEGALRIVEADSLTGRFRANFEGTVVGEFPFREEYQTLPDTVRFTEGEFVIDLNAGT